MKHSYPNTIFTVTFVSLAAAGVSLAALLARPHVVKAQVSQVPPRPKAVAPQWTPYQLNAFLFHNWQEAAQALDSPDILMRRSGVEWLGRWTATDGGSHTVMNGVDYEVESRKQLRGRTALVAGLTRAVREMPDRDSQQAARLLGRTGPSARPAIPAICEAISNHGSREHFVDRADLTTSLTLVCGGTEKVAPTLALFLQDHDPRTRRAVAAALAFRGDLIANRRPGQYDDLYLPPEARRKRFTDYNGQVIPALAAGIGDSDPSVRLIAARSLRALAYGSDGTIWNKTLPSLAFALSSPDTGLRQEAAHTLAVIPADLSVVTPALRNALGIPETMTHAYVFIALMHAAQVNRTSVLNTFLKPLTSPNPVQRRAAATDIRQVTGLLWDGQFWPDTAPTEDYYNNDAENVNLSVWMPPYSGYPSPAQQAAEGVRRSAANNAAKSQLLAALVSALSDHDAGVRDDAAFSLDHIGRWTDAILAHGGAFREGERVQGQVATALAQAAAAVRHDDSALSQRLQDLRARILMPHDRA